MTGSTMQAVRFDHYGEIDVLNVLEVPRPHPEPGRVVVDVVAAAINPGEAAIRRGLLDARWPAAFPSGQGSDLAGVVAEIGEGVDGVAVGDEVIGWSDERSSQAEAVSLPADHVAPKPPRVPWEAAGSLYVAGTTAWVTLKSVGLKHGEVVAISAASGGVGSIAIQLARHLGATVLGIAGAGNASWLESMGITPVTYGEGLGERLRAAADSSIDAFIDCFGGGYVDLAVDELGVKPDRVETIIDGAAGARHGTHVDGMSTVDDVGGVISELASMVEEGQLTIPVAATFALSDVRPAFELLEQRHTRGKIVLVMGEVPPVAN
ncbi:MAG TPA: NADP-dependent oxidoreductase [Acidimicrobiales bacterium]|jgi:NADPH:quinone reductase-like Zn-dependent oxidoreductase|nr:NADP-dependent oxidoreductase [Acidimicrobiales bacterium]